MFRFLANRKAPLLALIIVIHALFSYYYFPYFFSSLVGTLLIIFLSYINWKNEFKYWLGFVIPKNEYWYVLLALLVFGLGSYFAIKVVARNASVDIFPGNYKNLIHVLFYTLNEEIILGALLLKGIKFWKKQTPDWIISVGAAALFSIVHFAFFKWIFTNSGNLHFFTLLALFAVGIFRNNLILRTGHIAYSWMLHFSWIFVMLGSAHFQWLKGVYLNDFERFELYLGDVRILGICIGLVILSFMKFKPSTSSE